ncbi:hypothetical protein [Nonomuraea sp. NPDC049646]|uniref:hypothetical protein n=1 Tax=unclassified Nonomuraea TaxID=2593643 RepID=UPI003791E488
MLNASAPAGVLAHAPLGTHGHVIPLPDGLAADCGGPQSCHVCEVERLLVVHAARGAPTMIAACGGPGVCGLCRQTLLATGIDLDRYTPPGPGARDAGNGRYTLAEARRELARRECEADGHDWDIICARLHACAQEVPISMQCARRCGHPGYRIVAAPAIGQAAPARMHCSSAHYAHGWCAQCPEGTDQEELQAWRAWANLLFAAVGEGVCAGTGPAPAPVSGMAGRNAAGPREAL